MICLDPTALDDARVQHGITSDEKLAAALGLTGTTIRNLRSGRSTPSTATLVKLRSLTGRPLDGLIISKAKSVAS